MRALGMTPQTKIYVAGHRGMVGSALVRALEARGHKNLVLRTRQELDLRDAKATQEFFQHEKPEVVLLAAARVGGILANWREPVEFLLQNLQIQNNAIAAAFDAGVQRLLFLGSSCIYPKHAPQPIPESALLSGALEPTNEPYALAKIAGIRLCQAYRRQYGARFISAMPCNLYGPQDNFDLETAHVLPALLRKFHEAKERGENRVALWGTGTPRREFLHVDDLADACLFLLEKYDADEPINVGAGDDLTVAELAAQIAQITGFSGAIEWDTSKPDGTPRKLLDISRIQKLGWSPKIPLPGGIERTYAWWKASGR